MSQNQILIVTAVILIPVYLMAASFFIGLFSKEKEHDPQQAYD